jgi:uncharacterized repeat protein (TIGR01451 family)
MVRTQTTARLLVLAVWICAPAVPGCRTCCSPPPPVLPVAPVIAAPVPPPTPPPIQFTPQPGKQKHWHDSSITLSPTRVIAPVGTEVVIVAGVCGTDGLLRAGEPVEWMLSEGGVGQIVAVSEHGATDWVHWSDQRPRKIDNTFALGTTARKYVVLTRGTPNAADDVPILRGQTWVSVMSPREGTSNVTAMAREVYGWDQRQQSATIHWVDAEWSFPPPAINPVGSTHTFTTTVTRHTDHAPVVGWRVRYEITGGPPAGFGPDGATMVEVPTNELGQASVEIRQIQPGTGANTISMEVIRPAELPGSDGHRLVVGTGSTTKTWTSAQSQLAVDKTGPAQGSVGATLTYRIAVSNSGNVTAKQVVVTDTVPAGLTYISSSQPADVSGTTLQWRFGDLGAGQAQTIEVNFRADRPGTMNNCVTAATSDGVTAQDCAPTTVLVPAIDVTVTGPEQALVGQEVTFEAIVTNRGELPATGLVIVDRFDAGLEHAVSASPIERDLEDLAPGQSRRIALTFRAARPGRLCHTVEVTGDSGVRATAQGCVTASEPAAPPPPGTPPATQPPLTTQPPVTPPTDARIEVRKTGPAWQFVNRAAEFVMRIKNVGTARVNNLRIVDSYDLSLDPTSATAGYSQVGDDLAWDVDTLGPGQEITFQVHCLCLEPAARACNRVTVTTAEGARADGEACLEIRQPPPGLSVTIADLRDPVRAGNSLTYEVRVTNNAETADRDVRLTVTLPPQLTPVREGIAAPTKEITIDNNVVHFGSVAEVRPGETLSYRFQARAASAGNVRVQASVISASLGNQPIVADESTEILTP